MYESALVMRLWVSGSSPLVGSPTIGISKPNTTRMRSPWLAVGGFLTPPGYCGVTCPTRSNMITFTIHSGYKTFWVSLPRSAEHRGYSRGVR
jgi:hypothetical protein